MSEPTVPQTRIRAEIRPDGSGVLDVNGTHRHIEPGAFPATRTTIVSHAAEFAAALRRPIGVTIAGADGHWDIVVHPDGSVSDVRQMPADAPTPPPAAPMHVPSAPHPPAASREGADAADAADADAADAQAPAFGQTGPAPSLTDETIVTHGGDADDDDADAGMTVPRVPSAPRSSESAAQSGDAAAGSFDARAAAEAADAPSETDAADGDDASAASGEGAVELPATHEQPHEHAADPAPSPALPSFQPPAVDDAIVSRAPEVPVSSPSLPLQAPIASVPGYDRAAYDPSLDETVARPRSSYAPIASVPSAPASSGRPAATSPFATPTPPASSGAPAAPAAPLASVPSAAAPGQPAASATPVSSAPRTSYAPGELSGPVTADGRHSFLEAAQREQPAQAGLRGAMTRMGIKVAPSEAELAERADERAVSQHWPGPRTIAVVNGKGGAGKTPTTVLLSAVFAQLGGAGVLAWDNNQTRGTLGWRTERGPHDSTLLELLPQAEHLLSAGAQAADLAQFVHHQSQDKYDVLRSKPMRLAHENRIRPDDVDAIHAVASKYYRLIVIDSGNDESDPMWLRMVDHADQIVVATTTRADHAEAGALLLEALGERDERSRILAQRSVVVVSQADPKASRQDVESVIGGYGPLAREVVRIPFDQALVDGHLRLGSLRPETRRAWLGAAAAVARGL